jgi:hypothetical protein
MVQKKDANEQFKSFKNLMDYDNDGMLYTCWIDHKYNTYDRRSQHPNTMIKNGLHITCMTKINKQTSQGVKK